MFELLAHLMLAIYALTGAATVTPCPTEDSVNCTWDADARGNGVGDSFTTIHVVLH